MMVMLGRLNYENRIIKDASENVNRIIFLMLSCKYDKNKGDHASYRKSYHCIITDRRNLPKNGDRRQH